MHGILDKLHHFLLPRESNNHRAKILHHSSLLVIVALLLIGQLGLTLTEQKYPDVLGITNNISIDELVQKTNQKRQEGGLTPLTYNAELSTAAGQKAQHMLTNNYWAHNSPDGTTPWVFIKSSGYQYIFAGENLARGFSTSDDVMNAWMASPGHKENIMSSNYKEIGFAVVTGNLTGEETVLVVEMFGSRSNTVAQQTSVASDTTTSPQVVLTPELVSITPTTPPLARVVTISPTIVPEPTAAKESKEAITIVESIQSKPLINEKGVSKNITLFLVLMLIGILTIDLVVVERKKIVRLASHNIDHIVYLLIILITIILFGKGLIL